MTVVQTIKTSLTQKQIKQEAERIRLLLALEKGYTSTLIKIKGGYRLLASDGKAVDFIKTS